MDHCKRNHTQAGVVGFFVGWLFGWLLVDFYVGPSVCMVEFEMWYVGPLPKKQQVRWGCLFVCLLVGCFVGVLVVWFVGFCGGGLLSAGGLRYKARFILPLNASC